jgi:hypothetical protein
VSVAPVDNRYFESRVVYLRKIYHIFLRRIQPRDILYLIYYPSACERLPTRHRPRDIAHETSPTRGYLREVVHDRLFTKKDPTRRLGTQECPSAPSLFQPTNLQQTEKLEHKPLLSASNPTPPHPPAHISSTATYSAPCRRNSVSFPAPACHM